MGRANLSPSYLP
ncbi:hypothetical protein LINPERPRIM_LOCUS21822 [Linum perenne]